ncbi:MAG TPA: hypothetical protein EYN14_06230 [Alphaproteobacteria bacterium]|nr:hypothetical protein [Alphaproteobacteria bacterium]
MATSKTGSFWLTETVGIVPLGTTASGTLDLGAYVDVGDQQAIAIEAVDVIWQDYDPSSPQPYDSFIAAFGGLDYAADVQLTDLNPGGLILRADDSSLIASGSVNVDKSNNVISIGPDLFPDTFGKLDESRMVVNDTLYIVTAATVPGVAGHTLFATVRIKARIVKLSTKDWMSIAIQASAADN